MKKEIWQEDQPVLRDDLSLAQSSKEEAIKERVVDSFNPGIVQDSQLFAETVPFEITVSTLPLRADIATGVAYDPQGERIIVDDANVTHVTGAPTSTSDNGIGGTTLTPQSTGSESVLLTLGQVNYIFITYLQTTDPSIFSLQDVTNQRLFTKAGDGYKIEVVTDVGPAVSSTPDTFQPNVNAIYLGAVDTLNVLSITNRSFSSLRSKALVATVPDALNTLNALGQPYSVGQGVTFDDHVNAIGTGTPTPKNPHGLSIADLSGFSGKSVEQHEKLFHESGISGDQTTIISALYGLTTDSAGSPFIGPTYARDNFLIKKLRASGTQNFSGNGVTTIFVLTGGLAYVTGSGNLKVFVNGVLQASPAQYTETSSTSVTFGAPPAAGVAISLAVDGEAVQVNGITVASPQVSEDALFYFVNSTGTFLDNGTYTIYLDAVLGVLRLAHNGAPVNTGYRVFGVTSGLFTELNTLPIATVSNNSNNFLLWQATWDSAPVGLGFDNFSNIVDKRIFGTVGSEALRRDVLTDTVDINHNVDISKKVTADEVVATSSFSLINGGAEGLQLISDAVGEGTWRTTLPRTSYVQTTAEITLSPIPLDNTIPTSTEGVEVLTLPHTPLSATNILLIGVTLNIGSAASNANGNIFSVASLFKDADVNAMAVGYSGEYWGAGGSGNSMNQVNLVYRMVAGTTSAINFKVRGGHTTSGALNSIQGTGSPAFGGVSISSMTITEMRP